MGGPRRAHPEQMASRKHNASNVFLLNEKGFIAAFSDEGDARGRMRRDDLFFSSLAGLTGITRDWSAAQLVRVWNNIPGRVAIEKSADRQTALTRIWKAVQTLASDRPPQSRQAPQRGTTKAPKETKNATEPAITRGEPLRGIVPGWAISTGAEEWNVAKALRLSPAPKLGGCAGQQLRFLSVSAGASVITDVDDEKLTVIRRRTGLPPMQRMWFHPQGFSLGYNKPRGSREPPQLFFFDAEARLLQQAYLSAGIIDASAGTNQWLIACRNGRVYAFSLDGSPLWNQLVPDAYRDNASNELLGLPIFHPRLHLATADGVLAVAAGHQLHRYHTSGQRLWSAMIPSASVPERPPQYTDLPTRQQRLETLRLSEVRGRAQIRTAYFRIAVDTIVDAQWRREARVYDLNDVNEAEVSWGETVVPIAVELPLGPGVNILRATPDSMVVGTRAGFVHVFDGQGTLQNTFQVGSSAVSDILVSAQGMKAAYCGGRLTLFEDSGKRISTTTELPEYFANLTDCGAGVVVWQQNLLWCVAPSGRVQLAAEIDRPIRGAWRHSTGFNTLAAELTSFRLSRPASRDVSY
jgi:hypothetical protein